MGNCYLDRSHRETGTWGRGEMADSAWVCVCMLLGAPQFLPLSASYSRFRDVFVLWLLLCFLQDSATLFNVFSMALPSLWLRWGLVKGTVIFLHVISYFSLITSAFKLPLFRKTDWCCLLKAVIFFLLTFFFVRLLKSFSLFCGFLSRWDSNPALPPVFCIHLEH